MNTTNTTIPITRRIHPLIAVAAVSITLVSLLGVAAITGVLPSSHGLSSQSAQDIAPAPKPVNVKEHTAHKTPTVAVQPTQTAQAAPAPAPAPQKAPEKNSAVGIGVGALVGGALGSQVGSGDGKTLATIAGAIGGGYIGNEVAKKNQK